MSQRLPGTDLIDEQIAADGRAIAEGRLQSACQSLFIPAQAPCRGAVLAFHGFTAGPWQFNELGPALAAAGLHVYAPRLPGHGAWRDGREDASELPAAAAAQRYGIAADAALLHARTLARAAAVPLSVFGFSMGGAMGLDLSLRYPDDVARLVLVAPLLRPQGRGPQRLFAILHALRHVGVPWILDRVRMSWGPLPEPPPGGWLRPGHWFFRLGHMYAALSYARRVAEQANKPLPMPLQVIVTANDQRCDAPTALRLLHQSPTPERCFIFPPEAGVPHAMLTAGENPDVASRKRITELTLEFLLDLHSELGNAHAHGHARADQRSGS